MKKQFKAESKRLLDLMINSIYTHQEIFLREIISNASDAIDKLAYISLTDQNVGMNRDDFAINIQIDKDRRALIVSDNGIGMSKEEMENNLGTICKSGSLQFKQEMESTDDIDIIGQFGVGFYSAFMVADIVTVVSKKYGSDEAWMWQSSGTDGYTINPCEKETVGTQIVMKLKEDTEDERYSRFLETSEIRSLIKKYSDYIRYPIKMDVEQTRVKESTKDSDKPEYETFTENVTLNSMIPIWQRNKKDVTEEEYNSFYREKFYDYEPPLSVISTSVEGNVAYKALLYIPSKAPYDFYNKDHKDGLQLYSSGVMIMENCEDLLPDHFRFVKGVVDSQDLSLNISREMLQHTRQLKLIASNLEKKIKNELAKMLSDDREKYEKFFSTFGLQIKYGTVSEYGIHKELLQDLLLFWSGKQDKYVTLKEYTDSMLPDQKYIYYATGESRARLSQLPQAERLRNLGFDVLYFTDEADEFVAQTLMSYNEKKFCNIAVDDLGLDSEDDKKDLEKKNEDLKDVLTFIKDTLGDKITSARFSSALGDHPVCVVPDTGLSFEMEKYMKRLNPELTRTSGKILELNGDHPIVLSLKDCINSDKELAAKYAELLYCQALLMADLPLEDPTAYTDLVCSLIK